MKKVFEIDCIPNEKYLVEIGRDFHTYIMRSRGACDIFFCFLLFTFCFFFFSVNMRRLCLVDGWMDVKMKSGSVVWI